MANFLSGNNCGFQMTFANGYRISVQFGPYHYANKDGKRIDGSFQDSKLSDYWEADSAEVAVFNPRGKFVRLGDSDDVIGWQSPNQVADLIAKYSAIKPGRKQ